MNLRHKTKRKATFDAYYDAYLGRGEVIYIKDCGDMYSIRRFRQDRIDGPFYLDGDPYYIGKGFVEALHSMM